MHALQISPIALCCFVFRVRAIRKKGARLLSSWSPRKQMGKMELRVRTIQ